MPEEAGSVEVKYNVISDAAIRNLEKLQAQFDKTQKAAEKQGKGVESAYKKSAKSVTVFAAITTGALYGIMRASAYSSLWLDQISYQTTRLATAILELTGGDEAIEFFIEVLKGVADELNSWGTGEDNTFWADLWDAWNKLSLKGKVFAIIITGIGILLGALALMSLTVWAAGVLSSFGMLTKGITKASIKLALHKVALAASKVATIALNVATKLLTVSIAFLTSPIGLAIIAILAIIAVLYLFFTKTETGRKIIEAISTAWSNFKKNISEMGLWKAFLTFIGEIWNNVGGIIYNALANIVGWIVEKLTGIITWMADFGKKIIKAIVDSIDKYFPGFRTKVTGFFDTIKTIFNNIPGFVYNKFIEIVNKIIDGIDSVFPGYRNMITGFYTKIYDTLTSIKTKIFGWGSAIVNKLIDGLDSIFPGYRTKIEGIYDKVFETIEKIKTFLFSGGGDMIQNLIDGIKGKLQPLFDVWDGIKDKLGLTTDDMADKAAETGKAIPENIETNINDNKEGYETAVDGLETYSTDALTRVSDQATTTGVDIPTNVNAGITESTGATQSAMDTFTSIHTGGFGVITTAITTAETAYDSYTSSFVANTQTIQQIQEERGAHSEEAYKKRQDVYHEYQAAYRAEVAETIAAMDKLISKSKTIQQIQEERGAHSDEAYEARQDVYHEYQSEYRAEVAEAEELAAADYHDRLGYASGGHVLRSGVAAVHQGEDIVHLKSLLSGIRDKQDGSMGGANITINPTINITSNNTSDPMEVERIAAKISKRMADEFRRITTGI